MPSITEGQLTFHFSNDWQASKYDGWSFYRNQFQKVSAGTKAVDIIAVDPKACLWAIEIKDFRQSRRTKAIDLADEVAIKVRDSLSGLVAAKFNANDRDEQTLARNALRCSRLRVALHLEQRATQSKLFPRAVDPAKLTQRLKQLLKAVDPHPLVVDRARMQHVQVGWTVV